MPESLGAATLHSSGSDLHRRDEPELTTRPATRTDVLTHYDLTCSFRAWVAELDGEPKAMIGIALLSPVACLFSRFEPEFREHLKRPGAMRLIARARDAVRASKVPVWTVAQPDEPDAPRILERLGFRLMGEIEGNVVYEYAPGE